MGSTVCNTAPIWLNASNGVSLNLRSNATQAFGAANTVNVTGSGTATIDVRNNGTGVGNVLSLNVLNIGGQTLHVTEGVVYVEETATVTVEAAPAGPRQATAA